MQTLQNLQISSPSNKPTSALMCSETLRTISRVPDLLSPLLFRHLERILVEYSKFFLIRQTIFEHFISWYFCLKIYMLSIDIDFVQSNVERQILSAVPHFSSSYRMLHTNYRNTKCGLFTFPVVPRSWCITHNSTIEHTNPHYTIEHTLHNRTQFVIVRPP